MSGGGNGVAGGSIHILMFPWLAFGHISPFAQLARTLVSHSPGLRITFITTAGNIPRVKSILASAANTVTILPLQLPHVPGLPFGAASTAELTADGAELLKVAVDGTRSQVAALLTELHPDAVLFDFATPWVCSIAAPLGIKALHFSVFSAVSYAFISVPARRLRRDFMSAPPGFPFGSPVATIPAYQAANLNYAFASFHSQPCVYDRVVAGLTCSDAVIFKSCTEMEGAYIDYISTQIGKKPVILAGPVVPETPQGELQQRWATWLSSFPDSSVIFASFGSETFLPVAAATQLLLGLEATNRPFMAVLNFPKDSDAETELKALIPPGFLDRVGGRGTVRTGWVQQQHILRHRSVGCFLNHAGFSSVVEGLVAGCRLVLLPMKNDQFLNAALFARELKVGVEVARRGQDGWFGRDDVVQAVTAAMAEGGDGDGTRWRTFFMDHAAQTRFAQDFVRDLTELVTSGKGATISTAQGPPSVSAAAP